VQSINYTQQQQQHNTAEKLTPLQSRYACAQLTSLKFLAVFIQSPDIKDVLEQNLLCHIDPYDRLEPLHGLDWIGLDWMDDGLIPSITLL
jgi:hypothetical protein